MPPVHLNLTFPCNMTTTRSIQSEPHVCDCREGFTGPTCDETLEWWVLMERARSALGSMIMLCLLTWAVLKIVHSFTFKVWKSKRQFVPVVTYIAVLGLLTRTISLPIQPRAYGPDVLLASTSSSASSSAAGNQYRTMLMVYALMQSTAVAIVAASFNLVVGFWLDITTKVQMGITKRTKITSIALAVGMSIISVVSIVMGFFLENESVVYLPIILATVVDTGIVTGLVIYLTTPCGVAAQLVDAIAPKKRVSTKERWQAMRRLLISSLVFWYVYVVGAALVGPITSVPGQAHVRTFISYITLIGEIGFYTSTLLIVDRRGGPFVLFSELMNREAVERHAATSSSGSHSSSSRSASHRTKSSRSSYLSRDLALHTSTGPPSTATTLAASGSEMVFGEVVAVGRELETRTSATEQARRILIIPPLSPHAISQTGTTTTTTTATTGGVQTSADAPDSPTSYSTYADSTRSDSVTRSGGPSSISSSPRPSASSSGLAIPMYMGAAPISSRSTGTNSSSSGSGPSASARSSASASSGSSTGSSITEPPSASFSSSSDLSSS